jgi:hypothetical protein
MKNFILFKLYKTPLLIPFLYWVGFVAFFFASYQFYELNTRYLDYGHGSLSIVEGPDSPFGNSYDHNSYMESEYEWRKDELDGRFRLGYLSKEEHEAGIEKIEKIILNEIEAQKKYEEQRRSDEMYWVEEEKNEMFLIAIIALIIVQLLWRVCCEWWERWFSFLNIKRDDSEENTTENTTSKLMDVVLLKAKITVPFYIILYALGALAMIGGLILTFLEIPFALLEHTGFVVFFVFAQIFWRLLFEFYIVLFKFLSRG